MGVQAHSSAARGVEVFRHESNHPPASTLKEGSWGTEFCGQVATGEALPVVMMRIPKTRAAGPRQE